MAAVGAGVSGVIGSWFLPPGVAGSLLLLLLLSVLLTALCSECSRHSFELQDSGRDTYPSALISVVKLEETVAARDNPALSVEKDFCPFDGDSLSFTSWRSQPEAPQSNPDVRTNGSAAVTEAPPAGESRPVEEENSVQFTPWRSHLGAPEQRDVSSAHSHPDHTYQSIGGGRTDANASTPTAGDDTARTAWGGVRDTNTVYAQVSRKVRQAPPPEVGQVREGEEGEEPSPPLPDREKETEG